MSGIYSTTSNNTINNQQSLTESSRAKSLKPRSMLSISSTAEKPLNVNSPIKDSLYIDMGLMEGIILKAVKWSQEYPNGFYKNTDINAQLDPIFDAIFKDGVDEINLSFAQISNIAAILNPDLTKNYTGTDKILEILRYNPTNNNPVINKPIVDENNQKLSTDIIGYFIQEANAKGIKVDLSFGGVVASMQDYVIEDPIKASNDLVSLMSKYNIENIDFDIENVQGLMNNGVDKVLTFFKTLHTALKNTDKKVFLTLLGSTSQGPKGLLKPLF